MPLLVIAEPAGLGVPAARAPPPAVAARRSLVNLALLAVSLVLVHVMARGAIWSPYYKITVGQKGPTPSSR